MRKNKILLSLFLVLILCVILSVVSSAANVWGESCSDCYSEDLVLEGNPSAEYCGEVYCSHCFAYLFDPQHEFEGNTCSLCGYVKTCSHSYGAWTIVKDATCSETGIKRRTCSKCGEYEEQSIAKLSHNYVSGKCSVCGSLCSHPSSHILKFSQATHKWYCDVCDVVTASESHSYVNGYCSECKHYCSHSYSNGVCSYCKIVCSHSFGAWSVTKTATCTATGVRTRTCTKCKKVETDTIAKISHDYVNGVCSFCDDEIDNVWKEICAECGSEDLELKVDQSAGYCGEVYCNNGHYCFDPQHQFVGNICSHCGYEKVCVTHTFGSWGVTKAATCTVTGTQRRNCSVCGASEEQSIARLAHTYVNGKCSSCGAACPHTYGSWTITKAATCTATGTQSRTCSTCGYNDTQSVAKIPHSYVDGVCSACGYEVVNVWSKSCENCGSGNLKLQGEPSDGYCGEVHCVDCGNYCFDPQHDLVACDRSDWFSSTCSQKGEEYYVCTVCSFNLTKYLPIDPDAHEFNSEGICALCGESDGEPEPPETSEPETTTPESKPSGGGSSGGSSGSNNKNNKKNSAGKVIGAVMGSVLVTGLCYGAYVFFSKKKL